jgi:hypothetical protein
MVKSISSDSPLYATSRVCAKKSTNKEMARINKACEEKIKYEHTRTKHHIKTNENINHIVHMKNDTKYLN